MTTPSKPDPDGMHPAGRARTTTPAEAARPADTAEPSPTADARGPADASRTEDAPRTADAGGRVRRRERKVRHAVVVGAGIAGLATARALVPHAVRVTIVDRDDLPGGPDRRAGIPQGRHAHGLQPGGAEALERLVPGYKAELRAAGADVVRAAEDVLFVSAPGWVRPMDTGQVLHTATRELIEWTLRRLVTADGRVAVRTGLDVTGLALAGGRVRGLHVRPRAAGRTAAVETIDADLVVDASGRRSAAPDWLAAAGFATPAETVIDPGLTYGSRVYRRRPGDTSGWKAAVVQAQAPHTGRAAFVFPVEGDRWIVTLSGVAGDVPPTDDAGYLAFAHSVRAPHVGALLERAEPLSGVTTFLRTDNRRRHYERLDLPEGFLATGDATCAFNPLYGQGMSVAALQAEAIGAALGTHLAEGPGADLLGFTAPAQKAIAACADGAWTVATGVDLRYPTTTGGTRSRADRLVGRYLDRVMRLGTVDPVANRAFFEVIAVLKPPESLMRPALAWRVLTRRSPAPIPCPWPLTAAPAPASGPADAADAAAPAESAPRSELGVGR
jgi:2-polyprenyl-6-methoxyphenol hydroxylase-like FAD-dependent oxidoreductase